MFQRHTAGYTGRHHRPNSGFGLLKFLGTYAASYQVHKKNDIILFTVLNLSFGGMEGILDSPLSTKVLLNITRVGYCGRSKPGHTPAADLSLLTVLSSPVVIVRMAPAPKLHDICSISNSGVRSFQWGLSVAIGWLVYQLKKK